MHFVEKCFRIGQPKEEEVVLNKGYVLRNVSEEDYLRLVCMGPTRAHGPVPGVKKTKIFENVRIFVKTEIENTGE